MTTFSAAQATAAAAPIATWFGALQIVYPTFNLNLLDGAGIMTINGETFMGADPVYGAFESIQKFSDGTANESPTLTVTMLPPSIDARTALAQASAQGAPVSLWVGIINTATGQPVSAPDLVFYGALDVPTIQIDKNTDKLELVCVSAFERFFRDDEGVRLCDSWHQSVWPGEYGLQFVTNVQTALPWGSDAPRPTLVTDISSAQSKTTSKLSSTGVASSVSANILGGF